MDGLIIGYRCSVCGTETESMPEWKCDECFAFPENIKPITDDEDLIVEAEYQLDEIKAYHD